LLLYKWLHKIQLSMQHGILMDFVMWNMVPQYQIRILSKKLNLSSYKISQLSHNYIGVFKMNLYYSVYISFPLFSIGNWQSMKHGYRHWTRHWHANTANNWENHIIPCCVGVGHDMCTCFIVGNGLMSTLTSYTEGVCVI